MTNRLRLAALALAAALAACGDDTAAPPSLLLAQPGGVTVFRGLTTKHAQVHPYVAIANGGRNELTLLDAVDDSYVPAPLPVPVHTLVFPVRGRPALVASSSLGDDPSGDPLNVDDDRPDLLVAVAAGDSRLQVIRTWAPDGAIAGEVELGGDILDLVALPSAAGTARVAAALSGDRIAIATFVRTAGAEAIDVAGATVVTSGPLGFQPVALAVTPGDPTRIWAATRDDLGGGVHGVAGVDVTGVPAVALRLDALAPTRLVAAARLAEAVDPALAAVLTEAAFAGQPAVDRVYAVLDESGCGLHAPIACGVVALDPATQALAPDPVTAGSLAAPFRAPIAQTGGALAATPPPLVPPTPAEPQYAGSTLRMVTALGARATTAAGAIASTDGALYFVDLGRWEMPSEQAVVPTFAVVSADPTLAASVSVTVRTTAGYTPTARWTATYQGELPGLVSRRAEAGDAGTGPWLAMQLPGGAGDVVGLSDPVAGVQAGDLVAIADPTAVGTCASFEAGVAGFRDPDPVLHPGGAVSLAKIAGRPEWDACVDALPGKTLLRATLRSAGWALVRGSGTAAVHVARPVPGTELALEWQSEAGLSCPAFRAPCDGACRDDCQRLLRLRHARRLAYVLAGGSYATGPALAFALPASAPQTRGLSVTIDTTEGRVPSRAVDALGFSAHPRGAAVFDRSWYPGVADRGVRFLVPYASGFVLDATPTLQGGAPASLR